MILNSWLNLVKYKTYQDSSNFFGVFGLGERVSKALNYPTGVYSMFNRDIQDPFATGKTPGAN